MIITITIIIIMIIITIIIIIIIKHVFIPGIVIAGTENQLSQ